MLRKFILLTFLVSALLATESLQAQDTLKVMSYNLLNYPNGRDDCGANLRVAARWDTLRKIVQYQKPDILMVCELQNEVGADSILNAALNVGSINYYARANFVLNQSGYTGLNNLFFYNTQKVILHSQSEILTDLRDIGEYVVYANDPNLSTYNDTNFIRFYVGHLKAGNSNPPIEENRRASECTDLRTYIDGISSTGNFILGGDFNFYTSTEPGYQILTTGGVNKLNDPINRSGNWHNNSSFADIHTQSTRSSVNIECGAPGGMDDRFDFILISDSVVNGGANVQYLSGSYGALGNDANHFNQSLNSPSNTAVPDSIANALYYMSDHLPVVLDLLITYPNVMALSTAQTEITCNGDCDGSATATVVGGSPPYTYQWDDPGLQTTLIATGLCAGTFHFTFTDSTGASIVDSVTIADPPVLVASFSDSSIISCSGDSSGFATITASGGIPAYTYLWDDPDAQTTVTATGLAAGTYSVTTTDDRTCADAATITITQVASTPLIVNISASTNILCNGTATGAATVSTSGGTTPYTFVWNDPSAQTDSIATGLFAGTHIVSVTDSAGCPGVDTIIITQTAALGLTIIDTATASCGSTDTYAAVSVSGGLGSYTYLWDDPSAQTTDTATALASGIYKIIVTDSVGCVDSAQANVVDFSGPTITITDSSNVTCFGTLTGSATVTPSGGTPPYTYSWSPSGGTDSTANFLTAGVHTVTVIDNAPCTSVISVTITEPPEFTATFTDSVDVLCFGDSTGTATATPVGGTMPYTYSWSNGDTDSIADSLVAGSYTITITDANLCKANGGAAMTNCFKIRSILVDACNPSGPESDNEMVRIEIGATDLNTAGLIVDWPNNNWDGLCQNASTSDIIDSINANIIAGGTVVEPTGGVLPAGSQVMLITSDLFDWQSHDWSSLDYTLYLIFQCDGNFSGHFKNADCACGTCALDRTLILDFGGGCSDTAAYIPCDLDAVSGGTDGDAVEFDDAGNPSYQDIGCTPPVVLATVPMTVTISQPVSAVASSITSSTNILCFNDSAGLANADGSGGTPPYTYLWNDPTAQTDSNATNLLAGPYTTYVTDNNGCIDSSTVTLTQPASALVASMVDSLDIVCKGLTTGSAEASAAGGTGLYTYQWNDLSSQTNVLATSLGAGTYSIIVTDANGCTDSATVNLSEPPLFTINTTDITDAHCGQADGSASVSSAGGTLPHTYLWNDPSSQTDSIATGLSAGTYKIIFTDGIGCSDSLTLVLNDLPGPGVNGVDSTVVLCNGDSSGTASVQAGGGSPPLTYVWDDVSAQTDSVAIGLPTGNYNVTVTDIYGCQITSGVTVTGITALALTTTTTAASCGLTDGTATVNVSGGTMPYTYAWNSPSVQTDTTATGLAFGTYTIVVVDSNSCTDSTTAGVSNSGGPTVSITDSVNVLCNGDSTGSATVTANGGSTPYTYLWDDVNAQTDSAATGLPAGTYNVNVTDNGGCGSVATVTITQNALMTSSLSGTDPTCAGACNGQWICIVLSGQSPYNYSWSDSLIPNNDTASNVCGGSYSILVTDSNGCTATASGTISDPTALSITLNATSTSCSGSCDGTASASPAGGTGVYSYSWNTSPVQTNSTATGLCAGVLTVTVTDNNGCNIIDSITILDGSPFTVTTASIDVICNGDSSGSAIVSTAGGATPFTYLWNDPNLQTTSNVTGLGAGTYNVVVTDSAGCSANGSVTVNEPLAIGGSFTVVDISCNGACDGSITGLPTGGSGSPSSWGCIWSNGDTGLTASNLCAGTYTVLMVDSVGCTASDSASVNEPSLLIVTTTTVDLTCNGGSDGSISTVITGGIVPYSYSWDNGLPGNPSHSNLGAGIYAVTVTDSSGCVGQGSNTINEPLVLSVTITSTPSFCIDSLGTATAAPGGGTAPYVYIWDDPNAQTNVIAIGLEIGTYNITVADINGCSTIDSVTITGITGPVIDAITVTNESCAGANDGGAIVSFSGGLAPYITLWTDSNLAFISFDPAVSDLSAGTYYIGILDAQNCPALDSAVIEADAGCFNVPSSFTPNADLVNDTWIIRGIQNYPESSIEIYNRWGSLLYSSVGYAEPWDGTYEGQEVASATYYYIIILNETDDPITGSVTVVR